MNSMIKNVKHDIAATCRLGLPISKKQEAYYLLFIATNADAYRYYLERKNRREKR